jgi:hypothetical protein
MELLDTAQVSTPTNDILRMSHQLMSQDNKVDNLLPCPILTITFGHYVPAILSYKSQHMQWSCSCFSLHQNFYSNSPFCVRNLVVIQMKSTGEGINCNDRIIIRDREGRGEKSQIRGTI